MAADPRPEHSCTVVCRPAAAPAESNSPKDQVHALAARLLEELAGSWRRHHPLRVEELLDRHPEVRAEPEAAVRLIYEEVCLRREQGESVPLPDVLARFPQWREQLSSLLQREWRLDPGPSALPPLPSAPRGYQLLTELGRGAEGRVFLATQPALANRPVVLKVTRRGSREHLSLARLQHTHIVPLHAVHDDFDNDLCFLCMPYFGGATWQQVFERLRTAGPALRSGRDMLAALDQAQPVTGVVVGQGPARLLLARLSFVRAVCWLGATLADALHYAHQRGLVHLDVKPSNVLLAADGEPMLLDFHLAQEPIRPGQAAPSWLGGTPGYMSPEQQRAVAEAERGGPLSLTVDGRSDVYSLGVLLYEALAGKRPVEGEPLCRHNPRVSVGLSDVIGKCLAPPPEGRYADAAALAADLRRHLGDWPLRGVANRSWTERWHKWRRRRPWALTALVLLCGLLGALLTVSGLVAGRREERHHAAETALTEGREEMAHGRYVQAARVLTRGLEQADGLPDGEPLTRELGGQLRAARRAQQAEKLHGLAEGLRICYVLEALSPAAAKLEQDCGPMWRQRAWLLERAGGGLPQEVEERIRTDLLDLAVCWADLRVRLRPGGRAEASRREVLLLLDEAAALFGSSPALARERQVHADVLGLPPAEGERPPRNVWDEYALGRWLLRQGDVEGATAALEKVVAEQPAAFWPNLCVGVCAARRGRHEEAVRAFCVCIGRMPENSECYRLRGEAYAALGRHDLALRDYDRARQILRQHGG